MDFVFLQVFRCSLAASYTRLVSIGPSHVHLLFPGWVLGLRNEPLAFSWQRIWAFPKLAGLCSCIIRSWGLKWGPPKLLMSGKLRDLTGRTRTSHAASLGLVFRVAPPGKTDSGNLFWGGPGGRVSLNYGFPHPYMGISI